MSKSRQATATKQMKGAVRRMGATPHEATATAAAASEESRAARVLRLTAPVLLLLLAAAVIWSSVGLGYWTPLGPGPGLFPLWLAVLLAALSGIWLIEQIRGKRPSPADAEEPVAGLDALPQETESAVKPGQVIAIVVSLVVLTALLEVLGFQLSMLLFLLFHLKVLGRRRWLLTLVLSAVGSFGIYTLFAQVLSVNLPVSAIPALQSLGL